jgi:hypothetical protein
VVQSACRVFPHRHNRNGSFDSICTQCFMTVATKSNEAELRGPENAHVCSGFDLGRILHPAQQTSPERDTARLTSLEC